MTKFASRQQQQGLGLIAAIFVITLMALIATGISRLVINNQQSHSQQLLSSRAQLAATTGMEYLLTELAAGKRCEQIHTEQNLKRVQSCQFSATCQSFTVATEQQFLLSSEGRCGQGKDQAIRQLRRQLSPSPFAAENAGD